jgi:rubrerythrin
MKPFEELWQCEGCGLVWEGVNPPDKCDMCDHEYFENMADLEEERAGKLDS